MATEFSNEVFENIEKSLYDLAGKQANEAYKGFVSRLVRDPYDMTCPDEFTKLKEAAVTHVEYGYISWKVNELAHGRDNSMEHTIFLPDSDIMAYPSPLIRMNVRVTLANGSKSESKAFHFFASRDNVNQGKTFQLLEVGAEIALVSVQSWGRDSDSSLTKSFSIRATNRNPDKISAQIDIVCTPLHLPGDIFIQRFVVLPALLGLYRLLLTAALYNDRDDQFANRYRFADLPYTLMMPTFKGCSLVGFLKWAFSSEEIVKNSTPLFARAFAFQKMYSSADDVPKLPTMIAWSYWCNLHFMKHNANVVEVAFKKRQSRVSKQTVLSEIHKNVKFYLVKMASLGLKIEIPNILGYPLLRIGETDVVDWESNYPKEFKRWRQRIGRRMASQTPLPPPEEAAERAPAEIPTKPASDYDYSVLSPFEETSSLNWYYSLTQERREEKQRASDGDDVIDWDMENGIKAESVPVNEPSAVVEAAASLPPKKNWLDVLSESDRETVSKLLADCASNPEAHVGDIYKQKFLCKDILSLKPGEWLTDAVINILSEKWKKDSAAADVYVLNTLMWSKANVKDPREEIVRALERWWSRNYETSSTTGTYLLPINFRQKHWLLCKINFSECTAELIDSLDDMGSTPNPEMLYFIAESFWKAKQVKPPEGCDKLTVSKRIPVVQKNSYDCGIYTLTQIRNNLYPEEAPVLCTDELAPELRAKFLAELLTLEHLYVR